MAVSNLPIFPVVLQNSAVQILPADTTALKTIFTAGVNGSKIETINIASDDSAAKTLNLYISDGTTNYQLSQFNIPATSGFTTTNPSVGLMTQTQMPTLNYDSNGNRYIYLKANWLLKANVTAAMTAAKTMHIVTFAEDF
jgi:hypothetical protein